MTTLKLNITSGVYKYNLILENLHFNPQNAISLDLVLPSDPERGVVQQPEPLIVRQEPVVAPAQSYFGVDIANDDDMPELDEMPELDVVDDHQNAPVPSARQLPIVDPNLRSNAVPNAAPIGQSSAPQSNVRPPAQQSSVQSSVPPPASMSDFLNALSRIQSGSSGRPDAIASIQGVRDQPATLPVILSNGSQLNLQNVEAPGPYVGERKDPTDPANRAELFALHARDSYVSRAGDPARDKFPIRQVVAMYPYQPDTREGRENQAMYSETFSALDDWLRTMMNVQDPITVEFAKVLDKEFGKYLLKMAVRLDDNNFARMIHTMDIPIRAQGVTENVSRLKQILIGIRQGLLNEVINALNTPDCPCDFCRM